MKTPTGFPIERLSIERIIELTMLLLANSHFLSLLSRSSSSVSAVMARRTNGNMTQLAESLNSIKGALYLLGTLNCLPDCYNADVRFSLKL